MFIEEVVTAIREAENEPFEDARMRWEYIKYIIRKTTMKYSSRIAKEKKERYRKLETTLAKLERDAVMNNEEICSVKRELAVKRTEEEEKARFLSRATWVEENEKSTAFFYRTAKANQKKSNVIELKEGNAELAKDRINDKIYEFYSSMYKARPTTEPRGKIKKALGALPKLSLEANEKLKEEITKAEVKHILFQKMNSGKSPGNDGLTEQLYRTLWEHIGEHLTESIRSAVVKGELSPSMRQSVVRLIQKKRQRYISPKELASYFIIECGHQNFLSTTSKQD
jgi:hypothetical protein